VTRVSSPAPSTRRPDSAAETIADALARYYVEQSLPPDGGEHDKWFRVHVGPIVVPLPNPPARRRAVFYHDVNHVVTGFDNMFTRGEMAIAGYELASGCGPYWIAWLINLGMFGLGLVFCPRDLFGAYLRGRRAASVYRRPDRDALRGMTVEALRRTLGVIPAAPPAGLGDRIGFATWSILAVALWTALPVLAITLLL
jgi:hypothetical protein